MDLLDRLDLETPVVQAGMGGGISRGALAGAVSAAGGLGTVGILPPELMRREVERAREIAPGRPVAVNLLMPFTTAAHVDVCTELRPAAVVLFCGYDPGLVSRLREAGVLVLHQIGSVEQATRALRDGADGLVVQGVEAGGHVLATRPLADLLPEIRALAPSNPLLAAGGIATAADSRVALAAGADAVVAGTRFLLTEECDAHPAYQQRVIDAEHTVLTTLFGLGWRDPHRVVPNAAVRRWCDDEGAERRLPAMLSRAMLPLARRVPLAHAGRVTRLQRAGVPVFSPAAMLRGDRDRLVDVTPLYAGAAVDRMHDILPAAAAVRLLTP
ncbi:MAG TPA: nitronate monooxygenase [Frankiaceae bacterium]|nr:nitronate monooxygenase [Frankiaceae bacterium]